MDHLGKGVGGCFNVVCSVDQIWRRSGEGVARGCVARGRSHLADMRGRDAFARPGYSVGQKIINGREDQGWMRLCTFAESYLPVDSHKGPGGRQASSLVNVGKM